MKNTIRTAVRKSKALCYLPEMQIKDSVLREGNLIVYRMDKPWVNDLSEELRALTGEKDYHLNGYVVYHKSEIPSEWHGNYEHLNFLNVHGGITYADVNKIGRRSKWKIKKFMSSYVQKLRKQNPKNGLEAIVKRIETIQRLKKLSNYQVVVFGFDCNHHTDQQNPNLFDPNYVLELTRTMDNQIRKFARAWNYYKSSTQEEKVEIIDIIRGDENNISEIGFGGLISLLAGKTL